MSEVLQATLIEDGDLNAPTSELHIIKAEPGSDIVSNINGLKSWVTEQIETYAASEIKTEDDYAQAKRDRTSLRAMGSTIDNERKRIKTLYTAPLKAFEDSVKDVTAPINQLDGQMKAAIDAYDEQVKDAKRAIIRDHYETLAPDIALPLPGCHDALVPYERIEDAKWLNRSMTDKAACDELDKVVEHIAQLERQLDGLNLKHPEDARAELFATLDIAAAIARDSQLTQQEEKAAALQAERERYDAEQAAQNAAETPNEPEPVQVPEPPAKTPEQLLRDVGATVTDAEPDRFTVTFRVEHISQVRYDQLIGWMQAHDIHGHKLSKEKEQA